MSEPRDCHLNNNDILSSCLKIINSGANTKKKTNLPSSHGIARLEVDRIRCEQQLRAEIDYWSHCEDIH